MAKEDIKKFLERVKTDAEFFNKLNACTTGADALNFLKEQGFNLSENDLLTIGKSIDWKKYDVDNEKLNMEELGAIAGGTPEWWQAFQYGFMHPISSIVDIFKDPVGLAEKVHKVGDVEIFDHIIHDIL